MSRARQMLVAIAIVAAAAVPALGAIDPQSRWGAPEQVRGLPPLVANSDVTTSPDGGILTVATGFTATTTVGARRIGGGPWIPVTVPSNAGPPPFRVDADDVGDFVVAAQASGGQVVVVPRNASTPQGAPLTTSGDARAALGAAGDAAAAWADATGSLHVSFRPVGTSWEAPAVLPSPLAGATIDGIDIAVGPSGHGVVVWTVRTATSEAVLASRRTGPGLWAAAQVVVQEPSSPPQDRLAIGPNGGVLAVDASGRAAVLWSKVISSTLRKVISGSMAADGAWTVDGVVGDSDSFSAVTLTLAMNRAGDALAGWSRGSGASSSDSVRSVTVIRRVAGDAWGAPETIARDADAGSFRPGLDVASDGSAIAGWLRRAPTGLAGVPVAAVRNGGGPWSAPVDLTLPKEGSSLGRHIAGVALDDAGHGVAAWSDGPVGEQTWIARFSPTSVPPKRVPTRLLKLAGPTSGLAGALVNLDVTLNQAVESAPANVQRRVGRRWRTVRAVTISGRKLRVAVRLPQPGSHRYRLVMNGVGTSAVVTIRSTRSTTPAVPVCERAQQAVAGAGAVWVTCPEAAGQTLWKIDTARRRRIGAPVQIGTTTAVAVGRGVVWLLQHDRVVPVDANTLAVGTPIELTPGADEAAIQIAADGGNVWVLIGTPDVPFGVQTLVRIDGGTRQITMRVALPATTGGEGSQAIIPSTRGIWIPRRLFEMGHDLLQYLLRVDRASGRVTRVSGGYDYGLVAGGRSGLWATRATTGGSTRRLRLVRIDPPAGPAGSDLSRFSLRALVVGNGRIWGDTTREVRGRNRLGVRLQHFVVAINPATARPLGVLKPIGPALEGGNLSLVPEGRRAWALIPALGVLLGVPSR